MVPEFLRELLLPLEQNKAGHVQDFHLGPLNGQLPRHRLTTRPGHHNVGEQQMYGLRMESRDPHRLLGTERGQNPEPLPLENLTGGDNDFGLIIDQQNRIH